MRRRGNCHGNVVHGSFFQLLKRVHIRRKVYARREKTRNDIFNYIEILNDTQRRNGFNNQLSPVEYWRGYNECLVRWWRFISPQWLLDEDYGAR